MPLEPPPEEEDGATGSVIKPNQQYRSAIAERGKFWPVDDAYLNSIGYPASGDGKYAILTYSINSSSTSTSGGGTGFESVWIKGGNGAHQVDVRALSSNNAMATMVVDQSGNQIENIQTLGYYDTTTSQNLLGVGGVVNSTAFVADAIVRVQSYGGDNWIQIGPTASAVPETGMLLLEGAELTVLVQANDIISTVGGNLNIIIVGV